MSVMCFGDGHVTTGRLSHVSTTNVFVLSDTDGGPPGVRAVRLAAIQRIEPADFESVAS